MPKYIILGLAIPIALFVIMHYWSKFTDQTKNKIVASIFGIIAVSFVILLVLLVF